MKSRKEQTTANAKSTAATSLHFQEVEVRRLNSVREGNKLITRFEKFKVLRQKVNITQEEADTINTGRIEHPDNKFFSLYLLPGQEVEALIKILD